MGIIRKLREKLINLSIPHSEPADKNLTSSSEDEYYEWFFVQNKDWNQPEPNYDEQVRWAGIKSFVEKVSSDRIGNLKILDLGCGRGWLTNLLSKYGKTLGVEPVAGVSKYAKEIFPQLEIRAGDAKFLLQDGYHGYFDLIVSSEVIEHVPEKEKPIFLSDIHTLLKSGGFVIISTPRKEALTTYLKYIQPSQPIENWLTENEMKSMLQRSGFAILEMRKLEKRLVNLIDLEVYQLWLIKKNA